MAALVDTFPLVPMSRVLLISPPPLWRDGAYDFSAEVINLQLPANLRELVGRQVLLSVPRVTLLSRDDAIEIVGAELHRGGAK